MIQRHVFVLTTWLMILEWSNIHAIKWALINPWKTRAIRLADLKDPSIALRFGERMANRQMVKLAWKSSLMTQCATWWSAWTNWCNHKNAFLGWRSEGRGRPLDQGPDLIWSGGIHRCATRKCLGEGHSCPIGMRLFTPRGEKRDLSRFCCVADEHHRQGSACNDEVQLLWSAFDQAIYSPMQVDWRKPYKYHFGVEF